MINNMILTKNKLKKNKFKDNDEMLYQLKFSHLEPIREDNLLRIKTSDRMTQIPDITNNFSQTIKKDMKDKETDTYDDLNIIEPPYYLTSTLKGFKSKEPSRAEKMAHVWSTTLEKKSPPTSNSEDDDENPFLRTLDRGLRVAKLTGSAMLQALNLTETVADAVLSPVISSALDLVMSNTSNENEDDDEEVIEEQPTSSTAIPQYQMRDRSRSRDSSEDNNMGHRLLRRGASRSRSSTPKGGYASSGSLSARGGYPQRNK